MKENLLKDIFNVYSLGGGSIQSLPKHMVRSETTYVSQEVQTDSCLSRTLFASKSEIEDLKTDLLGKISELREGIVALKNHPLPSNTILHSSLLIPSHSISLITRFITAAVGKIYKLRALRLRELEAPWLSY